MLLSAPADSRHTPVARPKSLLTGEPTKIEWSANWDDDLGGSQEIAVEDPVLKHMNEHVAMEFEKTFMFYLPRICEHCLNPSCVASCPSGAMYKRAEDGIVLVDQEQCRGWRMCVTGCPYKKVYFNHKTGKAEKCTLCYPRIEVGPAHRVLRDLRGPAALPRPGPLRRRPGGRGGRRRGRARPARRAALGLPRPVRPRRHRRRRARRHPQGLDRRRPGVARSGGSSASTRWRCRCTRSTARCRWSGTSRR